MERGLCNVQRVSGAANGCLVCVVVKQRPFLKTGKERRELARDRQGDVAE